MTSTDQIAIAAAFIALCAFVATAWQAVQAHRQTNAVMKHNRLSVRPLLVWNVGRSRFDTGCELTFTVCNYGVGPAVVRDRYFTLGGERFTPSSPDQDEVEALAGHVLARSVQYWLKEHSLPGIGAAIKEGSERVIARLHFPRNSLEAIDALLEKHEIQFCLDYECLYGEQFELRS